MILDLLNVLATTVLAYAAITIARQANLIADRSVRVEADKHIFEWGQRCLNCLSRISSLRLIGDGQIEDDEFRKERRSLRAELFALKEEGALFFGKDGSSVDEPALVALKHVTDCIDGRKFEPPKSDDYDTTRRAQNTEIRQHTRTFIHAVQSRVGTEWVKE